MNISSQYSETEESSVSDLDINYDQKLISKSQKANGINEEGIIK